MKIPEAPLKHETRKGRFKGSLTGTLVQTLLIFTFIPLALMAGSAYFRARALLREQTNLQMVNLLTNQVKVVGQSVELRENILNTLTEGEDASILIEAALHANPQSSQFRTIRREFFDNLSQTERSSGFKGFDVFLLLDNNGNVKLASDEEWEGTRLDSAFLEFDGSQSKLASNIPPLYEDQLVLLTGKNYTTKRGSSLGFLVGITDGASLQDVLQPLSGLAPYAETYFILPDNQILAEKQQAGRFSAVEIEAASGSQIISELNSLKGREDTSPEAVETELVLGTPVLAQLQWLPSIQSGVILAIESNTVFEHVNSLTPFMVLLVIGTIGAMGVFLYYGASRVIRPLQYLAVVTRKFAEGDWSQRAEDIDSDNEIGLLSNSFNYLADQIEENYKSLEKKVEERTLQIRTAAEVAQGLTSITNLDEILKKMVELLVQQFNFYQASIFMIDRNRKQAEFKIGYGSATKGLTERKYSLPVGSASIIGWVAAYNQVRVASDVAEDSLHLKNELLPETRSEACVPISLGDQILGVLDVQSTQPGIFSPDAILMLQTLANQAAAAIQTAHLIESSQVDFQELNRLYRSSRLVAEAKDETGVLRVGGQIIKSAPYPIILFQLIGNYLKMVASSDIIRVDANALQHGIQVSAKDITTYLSHGTISSSSVSADLPKPFRETLQTLDLLNAIFMPIRGRDTLEAVILIGSRQQLPTSASTQPYENLADLMSVAIQRAIAITQTEKHLREVESLASINDLIASSADLEGFFHALLTKIQQIIGDYSLVVAIYNEENNTVNIPFSYENGRVQSIQPFPLGEGLTSILIRTRQPLLLVKDTERKAAELGAKVVGKPARSWMGAPMIVQGAIIGALIIQDPEHEGTFDEDDLKFFTTVASQVAGVIKNIQLLEESKQRAIQVEAAAEIARDVSKSLNPDLLFNKAVNLIRDRFNFYHAGIFLIDQPGEFATIQEATGDAGAQLKRQGYKIGVGSKSIVGFVSGKGETLVINDTTKDLTYYPNPLLPDTRAEAAIPMRAGERVRGVLDVQSTVPYAFQEDNLRSLNILADQLAIAVENSELFAETQEHLSQHRLLHHITSSAASGTTLEEALESAVSGLQVTLGGDRVIIMLLNKEKQLLEIKASVGYAEEIAKMKIEVGTGVTGWVAAHKRPLRIGNVNEDPRYIETSPNTRSELAIPLIYRNELLGVLNVESEQTDAYSENDEEMLGTLGGSLAAVIANARLLEQIRAQGERERLINEITTKIRRSTDIQSILHTTASEISKITGARFTKIQVEPKNQNPTNEGRP